MICKDVVADKTTSENDKAHLLLTPETPGGMIKDDFKWHHFDFILIHPSTTSTAAANTSAATLIGLGTPVEVKQYFDTMLRTHTWIKVIEDPYLLLAKIMDVTWVIMDTVAWRLADIFRNVEKVNIFRKHPLSTTQETLLTLYRKRILLPAPANLTSLW